MAEKLGVETMQTSTTNAKLFIFCIFVLFYAGFSTKSELRIPSED